MLWLVSGVALILAGCEKQLDSTTDTTDRFVVSTVYASTPGRTANDGLSTLWEANNDVNLFAVESGLFETAKTDQIHNHGRFITDGSGVFTFTSSGSAVATLPTLDPTKSYDWFMLYGHKSGRKKPFGLGNPEFVTVGSDVTDNVPGIYAANTQVGVNSTAHLCGSEGFPLQGMVTTSAGDNKPCITMHQITSVVEVVLTNEGGTRNLAKIELTSNNHTLVGRFIPDWSKENGFNLRTHGVATRASKTAALKLNNASLKAGEVGSFYLGIKPHEMTAEDTLTVKVTFLSGVTMEKTFTGVNTTFSAGKIKKVYMTI